MLRALRPGSNLLVSYGTSDPGWGHERLVLWPVVGDPVLTELMIYIADGDQYLECAAGWEQIWDITGMKRYPTDVPGDLIQFKEPVEKSELMALVKAARQSAKAERAARSSEKPSPDPAHGLD